MNNHKVYDSIKDGVIYKTMSYIIDNNGDDSIIDKFIKKYEYCKTIQINYSSYIPGIDSYFHEHYNPAMPLSKTTYYNNGEIIYEFVETKQSHERLILEEIRRIKLNKINKINESNI